MINKHNLSDKGICPIHWLILPFVGQKEVGFHYCCLDLAFLSCIESQLHQLHRELNIEEKDSEIKILVETINL